MERRKDKKGRVLEKGESQRKDGRYVYQYKDRYGNRKSIYASNLSDLRKEEKKIWRDLEENIDTAGGNMTLNELFDKYLSLKTQLANSTRINYIGLWNRNIREHALGNRKISNIKKSDILGFYNSLSERGLKYSTIKIFHNMLFPCFELAVEDDMIRKNPCKNCIKEFYDLNTKEKEALTKKEQMVFLEFVKENNIYYIYYPMFVFMFGTAVRCGETIGLTWNDVDLKNREVHINHQLIYKKNDGSCKFYINHPKTKSGMRSIPLTMEVVDALKDQRELQFMLGRKTEIEIDGYSEFVFSTKSKKPFTPSEINHVLIRIVNAYNKKEKQEAKKEKREMFLLPHISAHTLRHTSCTRMAEEGMDIKVLQEIMGHNNIAVTMEVYNHVSTDRCRKEMDKMEQKLIGK